MTLTESGGNMLKILLAPSIALVLLAVFIVDVGADHDTVTVTDLGRVVVRMGSAGTDVGYSITGYGELIEGRWPGAMFADGQPRDVSSVFEDEDGWHLEYSGAPAPGGWRAELDTITVNVLYEDGRDARTFVLGGFIAARSGRTLTLTLTHARDWADRTGQMVVLEFSERLPPAVPPPAAAAAAEGQPGSFVELLSKITPGGPVMAQALIVIMVYTMFIFTAPPTPWGIMLSAIVLILTPWVPVLFGYGSTIAGSIVFVNVVAGAYAYKVFAARTEA